MSAPLGPPQHNGAVSGIPQPTMDQATNGSSSRGDAQPDAAQPRPAHMPAPQSAGQPPPPPTPHTPLPSQPPVMQAQATTQAPSSGPPNQAQTPTVPRNQSQPPPSPPRDIVLKVRVLALETRGKDLCVRLDANTNHPSFRFSHYPPLLRSYRDLTFFALSLSIHVPTHILASLPLPSPTFDSSPSESRLLSYSLSKWFTRLVSEPAHRDHPETRNFIESEYSYQPLVPNPDFAPPLVQKRWRNAMDHAIQAERGLALDIGAGLGLPNGVLSTPATPAKNRTGGFLGFGGKAAAASAAGNAASASTSLPGGKGLALSRNVNDEDEDLVAARMEVTRLELQFNEAAKQGTRAVESRSKVTQELHALSNKLHTFAGLEDTRQLSHQLRLPLDLRKLADDLPALDVTSQAASHTDHLTLLYQLSYQSLNARSAKEALLARNALVEEHHEASKRALLKKRDVESLKSRMGVGSSGISRDRIEFAIEDFSEASRYAHALRQSLVGMSSTMHKSLQGHSRNAHADLQAALVEHAKGNVFHLRRGIAGLKDLRAVLKGDKAREEQVQEDATQRAQEQEQEPAQEQGQPVAVAHRVEEGNSTSTTTGITPAIDGVQATPAPAPAIPPPTTTTAATAQPPPSPSSSPPRSSTTMSHTSTNNSTSTPWSNNSPRRPAVRNPWTGSNETSFHRHANFSSPPVSTTPTAEIPGTGHYERFATPPPSLPVSTRTHAVEQQQNTQTQTQTQSMFLPRVASSPPPSQENPFANAASSSASGFLPRSDSGFGNQSRFGTANNNSSNTPHMSSSNHRPKGRISASDAARSLAGRF